MLDLFYGDDGNWIDRVWEMQKTVLRKREMLRFGGERDGNLGFKKFWRELSNLINKFRFHPPASIYIKCHHHAWNFSIATLDTLIKLQTTNHSFPNNRSEGKFFNMIKIYSTNIRRRRSFGGKITFPWHFTEKNFWRPSNVSNLENLNLWLDNKKISSTFLINLENDLP